MKPITIFTGSTGLNIVEDPVRLPQQKDGKVDMQAAVNVSVDQSARVNSRKGVSTLQTGNFHSLFCDGGDCFVVKDTALYQVAGDGSLKGIRSGLTAGARMDFTQVGDRTYYMNGYEMGIIKDGISSVWSKGTYTGVKTTEYFSGPFPGHHLTQFFSRMCFSWGEVLLWSEQLDFGLYNEAKSFVQFQTKILMLKPVATGMFLSTEKNTYFLEGTNPSDWKLRHILNYPAIEWSDAIDYVALSDMGMDGTGMAALWASREGVILGLPSGEIMNLNKDKIIYPSSAKEGFGVLVGFNYIHGVK